MADYPTIRAPLRDSWTSLSPDGVRRTTMDAGPRKQRRESSADPHQESWTHKLLDADAETLANFYEDNKALRFDLDHWVHGDCEAQFDGPPATRTSGLWTFVVVKALVYL